MTTDAALPVLVRSLLADPELRGPAALASLATAGDALLIVPEVGANRLAVRLAELAGLAVAASDDAPATVRLYTSRGVAVALQPREASQGVELLRRGRELERLAYELPELTRGLRGVGTRRGASGADHDLWFGPLLAARHQAAAAGDWRARAAALAPDPLRERAARALEELAAVRYPASPPDRRALAAELEGCAEPLDAAFGALARAAAELHAADDAVRVAAWRGWVGAARQCFAAADAGWLAMAPVLARHAEACAAGGGPGGAGARRRFWRRGGGGGRAG